MAIYRGEAGSDTYIGTDEADTIYGYPEGGSGGLTLQATRVVSGLTQPTFVVGQPNNPNRLYILEKGRALENGTLINGKIKFVDLGTNPPSTTDVLSLRPNSWGHSGETPDGEMDTDGEQGMLGFAFHPQFDGANERRVYVSLSNPMGDVEVREYSLNDQGVIDTTTEQLIIKIGYTPHSANHRAGWIGFNPKDGMLYIATGEGDQGPPAQDPGSLLGKILRINVNEDGFPTDPDKNYAIPTGSNGNPTSFDGIDGTFAASEVYAIGFRNPWRASIDSQGRMFIGDVGADEYEEINLLIKGGNYGWGHTRPDHSKDDGPEDPNGPYTNPINWYYHPNDPNIPGDDLGTSVTGGYVYEGPVEALRGSYIFGDFASGKIMRLTHNGETWVRQDITNSVIGDKTGAFTRISSFGQDSQGNLYVVEIGGDIYRLNPQVAIPDVGDLLDGAGGNDTIYGGGGDDTIYGGADSDRIDGDEGNDTIYGGNATGIDDSADTLTGGDGDDTYYVSSGDTVIELTSAAQSNDEVRAIGSFTLGANQAVEVLRAWPADSEVALDLMGNELAQRLIGSAGANVLNGGGGPDTLIGSAGNDTYVVDGMDTIVETNDDGSDAGGIDTVRTALNNYTLGTNLENLILLGTAAINGSGNSLDNIITGNSAANSLSGGDGVDTLIGGGGNDTLNGGDRSDSLGGGAGDDTYRIYSEETIEEAAGMGIDTVIVVGEANYTLGAGIHVEVLKANPDNFGGNLTGNELNNTLYGNRGRNNLDGGAGEDTVVFSGKRADYTIERNADGSFTVTDARENGDRVDTITRVEIFKFADITSTAGGLLLTDFGLTGDVVEENSPTGFEFGGFSIKGAVGTLHFELLNNAEGRFAIDSKSGKISVLDGVRLDYEQARSHLVEVQVTDATGATMRKTFTIQVGNSLNETATGSALGDVLKGGDGQDVFKGASGNDRLYGDLGNDRLYGESGDDTLEGSSGNDLLDGGLNNDRLIGGLGKDTFTGGKGRDVFVFDDRETGSSKSKADYITDFSGRGGDRIDLKLIDANTKKRGDQKFSFIGDDKSFSKAGEVRFEKTKSATYVYLNTDNDKAAEAVIKLKGSIELSKSWFVL
jgi:Ca2+-binding RTX toxin-like protein